MLNNTVLLKGKVLLSIAIECITVIICSVLCLIIRTVAGQLSDFQVAVHLISALWLPSLSQLHVSARVCRSSVVWWRTYQIWQFRWQRQAICVALSINLLSLQKIQLTPSLLLENFTGQNLRGDYNTICVRNTRWVLFLILVSGLIKNLQRLVLCTAENN
jgi:hypothetical protein